MRLFQIMLIEDIHRIPGKCSKRLSETLQIGVCSRAGARRARHEPNGQLYGQKRLPEEKTLSTNILKRRLACLAGGAAALASLSGPAVASETVAVKFR